MGSNQEGHLSGSIFLKAAAIATVAGAATIDFAQTNAPVAKLAAHSANVINLTQVGCQFIESENGKNLGYSPAKKADCVEINGKTGDKRLGEAKVLELEAGEHTFRVVNKNVPYEFGFW